ncbi:MAG: CRISPR-associated protein Cas5 [Proteobacteria bacterium]|nr:CRISPR-associated protein Cas5 [Pseudomonadota bacterium]
MLCKYCLCCSYSWRYHLNYQKRQTSHVLSRSALVIACNILFYTETSLF